MSKYTTQVRWVIDEVLEQNKIKINGLQTLNKIELARPYIFNFNYPYYTEEQKINLENKILMHYYMREIGFETVGLWKLRLQSRLMDIMPYYIKLYEQEYSDIDLYANVDYESKKIGTYTKGTQIQHSGGVSNTGDNTRTDDLKRTDKTTRSNNFESDNLELFNDTPQGAVHYNDPQDRSYLTWYKQTHKNDVLNNDVTDANGTNTGTVKNQYSESSVDTTKIQNSGSDSVDETYTKKGREGGLSNIEIIMKVRESFINIDLQIIKELEPLFMQLW